MKKFLSLVLTLALTLSLVVVPARAADSASVERGKTGQYSAPELQDSTGITVGGETKAKSEWTDYTEIAATGYSWSVVSGSADYISIKSGGNTKTVTVNGLKETTTAKLTCTITYTMTPEVGDAVTGTSTYTKEGITVTDALLASDIETVTINGRTYNGTSVFIKKGEQFESGSVTLKNGYKPADTDPVALSGKSVTIKTDGSLTYSFNATELADTLAVSATPAKIVKGGSTKLSATYNGSGTSYEKYVWSYKKGSDEAQSITGTGKTINSWGSSLDAGTYTVTCAAYEKDAKLAENTVEVEVVADTFGFSTNSTTTKLQKGESANRDSYVEFRETGKTGDKFSDLSGVTYTSSDTSVITVNSSTGKVTAVADGEAYITVKGTYLGKEYTSGRANFSVVSMSATLGSVENGDYDYFTASEVESAVVEAVNKVVTSANKIDENDISKIEVKTIPGTTEAVLYNDDYSTGKKITSSANKDITSKYLYVEGVAGRLGTISFDVTATAGSKTYTVTLKVDVEADETVDATASGEEYSSTQVSFELPDDYDYWFIYTGSASFKDEMYEGSWKKTGTEPKNWDRYAAGATCKVNAKYEDGDVKLYVVGLDDDGVASTGKLVVALDAYDIKYSGVAGETITFDQDDFDDLLEEVAEDRDQDGSKAKVEFTNVTFTLPTEKTAGILYNNGEQIKSNSKTAVKECTDLDKVTFAIADKAKSEVIIKFKMTYDYYSDSSKSKPTEKGETVNGRVVVSVVNEDIKYSVPVGGNVVFDASDFEDFFTDEYKNGTLSYVTFDKYTGTNGILYATYSTIGYGTTAKTNDKFYYDSSKAADLDLDDVTFVSSTFAKAGEKIYLPFTAYGTKSSQKVEGCVAITLTAARTMNFIDVTTADWFYNNVKNAFTMGLIEGKTTTTFNPNDNMTWAEAVTLAARMNELYYTGKVTLSNSTSGNWYSNYESYAISKGIISTYLGAKANTNISRRDYVDIFYNALPYSAYTARNSVTKIPDLANDSTNAKIYTFYRAGILTGYANTAGKANGSFGPNDNIKRSEVATILIRMMDSSTRMYFTL